MLLTLMVCLLVMSFTASISTSDGHKKPPKPTGIWRAKMRHFLSLFDDDHDGLVDEQEFAKLTSERARSYLGEEAAGKVDIVQKWAWMTFYSIRENDYKTVLTYEDSFESHIHTVFNARPWKEGNFTHGLLFDVADIDKKNGMLSLDEFKKIHAVYNVAEEDAILSFQNADNDQNGVLDKEEYLSSWVAYFWETVDSKNSHFFGEFQKEPKN